MSLVQPEALSMSPEQREQMQYYVSGLAQILYDDAEAKGMNMASMGEIEQAVRTQLQTHVSPKLGIFLSKLVSAQMMEKRES